ncbi:MAG: hypothetical protein RJQ21_18795, partial [Rhodospirillales bacterium]
MIPIRFLSFRRLFTVSKINGLEPECKTVAGTGFGQKHNGRSPGRTTGEVRPHRCKTRWNRTAETGHGRPIGGFAAAEAAAEPFRLPGGPESGYSAVRHGWVSRPNGKCRFIFRTNIFYEVAGKMIFKKYFCFSISKAIIFSIFLSIVVTEQVSATDFCKKNEILIKDNLLGWSDGVPREFVLRNDVNIEHSSETGGWVFGDNFPEANILRLIIYKKEEGDEVRYIDLSDLFFGIVYAEEMSKYIFYYLERRDFPFSICGKETLMCRLSFSYEVYDVEIISLLRNKDNIKHFSRKMIS